MRTSRHALYGYNARRMSDETENIADSAVEFEPRPDVPLAPLTTIGIGGPASFFFEATTEESIAEAIAWARGRNLPLFVLGGGSNLLISDDGFPGLVLQIATAGISVEHEDSASVVVRVAAGEAWDGFVATAVGNGWAGIECLSGIPGSTGATPIQNVGAYGQEVSETILHVDAMDRATGRVRTFSNEECRFQYRESRFKTDERDMWVILSVTFKLVPGGAATIRYPELARELEARGAGDLPSVRKAVIEIRKRKGMVIDPLDPDTRSDGSFFMNPILGGVEARSFLERAASVLGPEAKVPTFPASGDRVKLSAAWLIENAGFSRGYVMGNAGLSTKHTLAVINRGGASAKEVVALVQAIQNRVEDVFGVRLQPEPNFVGFRAGN